MVLGYADPNVALPEGLAPPSISLRLLLPLTKGHNMSLGRRKTSDLCSGIDCLENYACYFDDPLMCSTLISVAVRDSTV